MTLSDIVIDEKGNKYKISKEIGAGGQGRIYQTTIPNIALKKFIIDEKIENKEEYKNILCKEIDNLSLLPIPQKINLTLPLSKLNDKSGYIMYMLEEMDSFQNSFSYMKEFDENTDNEWLKKYSGNKDFVDNFNSYIYTGGKKRRLEAYIKSGILLSKLHDNGLVFCDFSPNNVFISKNYNKCNVWLIDTDNIDYISKTINRYLHTPEYSAPEIIKSSNNMIEAKKNGSTFYSDSYSFVVSLFKQLTYTHPFDGEIMNSDDFENDDFEDNDLKMYLGDIPWIKDSFDDSNNGETLIPYEMIIGDDLKDIFEKMFSEESRNKNRVLRPSMVEITNALVKEFDKTITCNCCKMDFIPKNEKCIWCGSKNNYLKINIIKDENFIDEIYMDIKEEFSISERIVKGFNMDKFSDGIVKFSLINSNLYMKKVFEEDIYFKYDNKYEIRLIDTIEIEKKYFEIIFRKYNVRLEVTII